MASGETTYYGLNQWQPQDAVLRTEFNQDNAKTDAALKGLEQLMGAKETALTAAINQRFGPDNPILTTGSYEGDYLSDGVQETITITLGFRPSLLLLIDATPETIEDLSLLLGVPEAYTIIRVNGERPELSGFAFSEQGFSLSVYDRRSYSFNKWGHTYRYWALR